MINIRVTALHYVILIAFIFCTGVSQAKPKKAMLDQVSADRTWGLLLGDDVTISVDVSSLDNKVEKSSLPQTEQRYGTWLYLKSVTQSPEQLAFHYMIINVPTKNTAIETPKFDVKLDNEKWLGIAPTTITIGPALAVENGVSSIVAKVDIDAKLLDTSDIKQQLKLAIAIAVLTALVLALWHFGWKRKNRQPFAQAVHDLSRFKLHTATADEAARILHAAFNGTAGTVVAYNKLADLFEQHPWLQSQQTNIEQFYQQSEQHFFARNAQQGPDLDSVRKLAKACRAKEMLA